MQYIATLNGKKIEIHIDIQIEKVPKYQPLTCEQIASSKTALDSVTVKKSPKGSISVPASTQTVVGEGKVISPVPGLIYDIQVAEGQTVVKGQVLFILEALKMENEIVSPIDGIVTSVLVKKGDLVDKRAVLAIIK